MSNISKMKAKFGHRIASHTADEAIALASTGASSAKFFRVKPEAGQKATVRFLPGVLPDGRVAAEGEKIPYIVSYKQHFVPGAGGRGRSIVCPTVFGTRCPICDMHDEALRTIGVEGKGKGGKPGRKEYHLPGDKFANGMAPKQVFLVQVLVLEPNPYGGATWEGPRVMEMSAILTEKIFGLTWKEDTYSARLTAQCSAEISDMWNGYAVAINGAGAPTFYTVEAQREKSGAIASTAIWPDEEEAKWDQLFATMIDLQSLIVRPAQEVIDFAVEALRAKLDEAILAMHGGPVEIAGEAEDATTIVASRKPTRTAAPALEAPAEVHTPRRRAPVVDAEPAAAPTRARAAATSFDFSGEEEL